MTKWNLFALVPLYLLSTESFAQETIDEGVVTTARQPVVKQLHIGNAAALSESDILTVRHKHLHELMNTVAGVWVSRGSGQESLVALRSPVLTGAGACGAYLTLEDGLPTRPAGFCNVNQLFELPSELASRVEVIRGPANALFGSNALHGLVNVVLPDPTNKPVDALAVELGANEYVRLNVTTGLGDSTVAGIDISDDGGFRDDSGYRQVKFFLKKSVSWLGGDTLLSLSGSDLDQETAGFIFGEDAYEDAALNRGNVNPEAFRDADSQRASMSWTLADNARQLDIRAFARQSDMTFLQHFLPGQPLEENGHSSAGVMASLLFGDEDRSVTSGLEIEWSDSFLRQGQDAPTTGSAFLIETRPQGRHYDYDVESLATAAFIQGDWRLGQVIRFTAGIRGESVHYDYVNKLLTGNTRDDGTACGFGGCLYTRPASRDDRFDNVSINLGSSVSLTRSDALYLKLAQGFRAPQVSELYRLQNGQLVSDLDSESIDSLEAGYRRETPNLVFETSFFALWKDNSVLRDSEGFNVSRGSTTHRGIEVTAMWNLTDNWGIHVNGTVARHQYDFDLVASRGETFVSGNDVDTAPRWQGGAEVRYSGVDRLTAALQWVSMGKYYLDAENQRRYPGHDIVNTRVAWDISDRFSLIARLNNLLDENYADRADFAFGNYRYFPGRGRELFVEFQWNRFD